MDRSRGKTYNQTTAAQKPRRLARSSRIKELAGNHAGHQR
jgi:hypothetical protein